VPRTISASSSPESSLRWSEKARFERAFSLQASPGSARRQQFYAREKARNPPQLVITFKPAP
jgi:hypothetical protein